MSTPDPWAAIAADLDPAVRAELEEAMRRYPEKRPLDLLFERLRASPLPSLHPSTPETP